MALKSIASLLLLAQRIGSVSAKCDCLPTPSNPKQTPASNVDDNDYVGEVDAYGWGCKAHDQNQGACNTSSPAGWCADQWCIVDATSCPDRRRIGLSFTADADDVFSYEACDSSFAGNSWAGYCKNCDDYPESFCPCGGTDGCPCLAAATNKTQATGKPAYPGTVPAYGSGCKAHDAGKDACATADTKDGSDSDWCVDKFCIVDKKNCDLLARDLSYTAETDYFSYETCDSNFKGNGWVGRCKCKANDKTYCTCDGGDAEVNSASEIGVGAAGVAMMVAAVFL